MRRLPLVRRCTHNNESNDDSPSAILQFFCFFAATETVRSSWCAKMVPYQQRRRALSDKVALSVLANKGTLTVRRWHTVPVVTEAYVPRRLFFSLPSLRATVISVLPIAVARTRTTSRVSTFSTIDFNVFGRTCKCISMVSLSKCYLSHVRTWEMKLTSENVHEISYQSYL